MQMAVTFFRIRLVYVDRSAAQTSLSRMLLMSGAALKETLSMFLSSKSLHMLQTFRFLSSDDALLHGLLADVEEVLPADGPRLPPSDTRVTVRVGVQFRHLLLARDRGPAEL